MHFLHLQDEIQNIVSFADGCILVNMSQLIELSMSGYVFCCCSCDRKLYN